jgi:hypothetical protein
MSIENLNTLGDLDAFVAERVAGLGFTPAVATQAKQAPTFKVGVVLLSWAGGSQSNTVTVPHGLGREPIGVLATDMQFGGPDVTAWSVGNKGPDSFDLLAKFVTGTWTGDKFFAWLVFA